MSRPVVKICGVTSPAEAMLAAELGADLVGLNFYPPSPRYLEVHEAVEIADAVRGRVKLVGVFVNVPAAQLEGVAATVGLDLLQFHGDETVAEVTPFAPRALKAFRVRDRLDAAALEGYGEVWGVLVDSRHPSLYGGSGESWNFQSLRQLEGRLPRRTFIAGGLNPDNVRAAIAAARPYGIDLCSGVEAEPGRKDPELLRRLFEEISHSESEAASRSRRLAEERSNSEPKVASRHRRTVEERRNGETSTAA